MHVLSKLAMHLQQKSLINLVCVLLCAVLGWQIARIIIHLLSPVPTVTLAPMSASQPSTHAQPQNYSALSSYALFGQAVVAPAVSPVTQLNLQLAGVLSYPDINSVHARALITQSGAAPTVFKVGDQIQTGVMLSAILANRVQLSVNGRSEMLNLPKAAENSGSTYLDYKPKMAVPSQAQLQDLVIASPYVEQGVIGFRLQPGRKPDLFKQVGLFDQDVLIAINGQPFLSAAQAMELTAQITQGPVSFTLLRGGNTLSLNFDLSQLNAQ